MADELNDETATGRSNHDPIVVDVVGPIYPGTELDNISDQPLN